MWRRSAARNASFRNSPSGSGWRWIICPATRSGFARSRRGTFDLQRTLRRNLQFGGVPFDVQLERRKKHRPQIVVLCDVSDSVRNVSRFMLQFVYSLQDLYSKVRSFIFVSDIGEVTGLFDMRTRPELLMLQKTMVVVEGVARSLDPKLDMWTVSEPVVREWIERNLGPAGRLEGAAEGAVEMGRFLSGVPGLMSRGAAMMEHIDTITRDGLVLAPETVAAIGQAEAKRGRGMTVALWAIAGLLTVLAIQVFR